MCRYVDAGVAPSVTTQAATNLGASTATVHGSVNPNGGVTTGWFRYATASPGSCNDSFGTRAPTVGTSLGSTTSSQPLSQGLVGLTANQTYYFCAIASNPGGTGVGGLLTFLLDTVAPSVPNGLSAAASSSSQINLSWSASTDAVGVAGYRVLRCSGSACTPSTMVTSVTTTTYADQGLSPHTTYVYAVVAYDAAMNASAPSSSASAATYVDLGETNMLTMVDSNNPGVYAQRVVATATGALKTLSFYIDNASGAGMIQLGVYSDAAGYPGSLLASTAVATNPTPGAWLTLPAGPATLSSGTTYWLAYTVSGPNITYRVGGGAGLLGVAQPFGFPGTFPAGGAETGASWSFYASVQ
jgi:hypothetical protein